jgi:hypothetical protein
VAFAIEEVLNRRHQPAGVHISRDATLEQETGLSLYSGPTARPSSVGWFRSVFWLSPGGEAA